MVAAAIVIAQQAIRYIIIAAVQLGIWTVLEKFVLPKINDGIRGIMVRFGVGEDEAKDIMANDLLEFAESVGIFAITLKSKLPLKVAELLGFTTKGWSKRVLSKKVTQLATSTGAGKLLGPTGQTIPTAAESVGIINVAKTALSGFGTAYKLLLSTLGVGFVGFIAVNNFIDFGNWNSGAYQKSAQKIIAFLTGGLLVPDADYRKSKTVSPEVFDKVYNAYKLEGVTGINNPFKNFSTAFTRDSLMDLLDEIGAKLLLTTGGASTKEVLKASVMFMVFGGGQTTQPTTATPTPSVSTPSVKVFTGVVTQGKLGEPGAFVARQTDLIDNVEELQEAAQNNLASFIMALPGRIVYEIKVVSSVTTKDGFVQRGTMQKVQTGTFSNGTPKYKTVFNKFATLNVYVIGAKGTRMKIDTVVLGPVNAANFTPTPQALQLAEEQIKSNIVTTDVNEINEITTNTPTEVKIIAKTFAGLTREIKAHVRVDDPFLIEGVEGAWYSTPTSINPLDGRSLAEYRSMGKNIPTLSQEQADEFFNYLLSSYKSYGAKQGWVNMWRNLRLTQPEVEKYLAGEMVGGHDLVRTDLQKTPETTIPSSNNPNKCNVATIAEFFDVNKTTYPRVAERAVLYEAWGLGLAAYYTGTAEQNNKFLAEVKRRSGC